MSKNPEKKPSVGLQAANRAHRARDEAALVWAIAQKCGTKPPTHPERSRFTDTIAKRDRVKGSIKKRRLAS